MKNRKQESSMDNYVRTIKLVPEHEPKYIVYTRKLGGEHEPISEYFTYDADLLKILMLNRVRPFRSDRGYLKFVVNHDRTETKFYSHTLAYGCYAGIIHFDSFLLDILKFGKQNEEQKLVIDHGDNNTSNNTKFNLSLMLRSENSKKGELAAKFTLPSRLSISYIGGKYRVSLATVVINPKPIMDKINAMLSDYYGMRIVLDSVPEARRYFICDDAQSLIACLQDLSYQQIEGCSAARTKHGAWKPGVWVYADTEQAIIEQDRVAAMEESQFGRYRVMSASEVYTRLHNKDNGK